MTFMIVMMNSLTMISAMNNYLYLSNQTYKELEEYTKIYKIESIILDKVKCMLLREEELIDFNIDDYYVEIYGNDNNYSLYVDNLIIDINIKDKMIISFETKII